MLQERSKGEVAEAFASGANAVGTLNLDKLLILMRRIY